MINWSLWTLTGRFIHRREKKEWSWRDICVLWVLATLDCALFLGTTITVYIVIGWKFLDTPHTPFSCNDEHIRNPLYRNTVSTVYLLVLTLFIPSVCVGLALLVAHQKFDKTTTVDITTYTVYSFLDYALCYWFMTLVLEILKCCVGRLRPNFVAMCAPDNLHLCDSDPTATISNYKCTSDYKYGRNSRASFPSGHSGAAVFAFIYLFLFFNRRLITHRIPENKWLGVFRVVILVLFLLFTVFCCASRITDYWHYPTDVLGGVLIGGVSSYCSFTFLRKPSHHI